MSLVHCKGSSLRKHHRAMWEATSLLHCHNAIRRNAATTPSTLVVTEIDHSAGGQTWDS